jgi:heptosyltransferase-1
LNILIVKLSHLGDVVSSFPFLTALRQLYPQARVSWLVEEDMAEILQDHPLIDRLVVASRKTWIKDIKKGRFQPFMAEIRSFLGDLRGESYDMVIDLQGLFKSGILAFLSGGKRRIAYARTRESSHLFYTERLTPYDPHRRAVLLYLDVAAYLGAQIDEEGDSYLPCFPVNELASSEARQLLGGAKRPRIIINPVSTRDHKIWPGNSWRELIQLLVRDSDAWVVVTGGPADRDFNSGLTQGLTGVLDLTGQTRLKVLAEVIRAGDLFIGPDTGPMHMAAMAGIPVIALFGPTSPQLNGPFGRGHEIIRADLDCSPCFKKDCENPICMSGIRAEQVYEAVKKMLARP